MTPEQAALYFQIRKPVFENEHRITKKMLEAVPAEKGEYCPDPCSKTAFDLAWHIAAADTMFVDAAASGEFQFDRLNRPDSIRNSTDVAKWYAETWQKAFDRLNQASGEQLAKEVHFRDILQRPAVLFLDVGMHHTIHHRGQLSAYLRPMGGKVPSIYGESYDDAQARKAAQAQTSAAS